jgi:MFS transporter, FSR family, fosmidomycin resistance protein
VIHILSGKDAIQLSLYGLTHAIVDTISAGILFTIWQGGVVEGVEVSWLFLLYNLLAFGIQPILGLIVDWSQRPRAAAFLGCLLVAAATVGSAGWPRVAVGLVGVGNAVFHLGAGSICCTNICRRWRVPSPSNWMWR